MARPFEKCPAVMNRLAISPNAAAKDMQKCIGQARVKGADPNSRRWKPLTLLEHQLTHQHISKLFFKVYLILSLRPEHSTFHVRACAQPGERRRPHAETCTATSSMSAKANRQSAGRFRRLECARGIMVLLCIVSTSMSRKEPLRETPAELLSNQAEKGNFPSLQCWRALCLDLLFLHCDKGRARERLHFIET